MKFLKIYKYAALVAVVLFTSCNKFLDVEPKGEVIPTTLDDFLALMSDPIRISTTSNHIHYLTDEITLPDDYRASAGNYPGSGAVKAYDFESEMFDVSEDDRDWTYGYRTIYIVNSVLAGLENNTEANQAKRNQVKGEALVHRAYTYLTLVNEYAKHYSSTAETDMGVPLNLKVDINALPARASVKEVYVQIEKDLLAAAAILDEKSTFSYRPNKAGAYGVLARMYLYMGNWDKAEEYAAKAFAIHNFIYDYTTFTISDPANPALASITGYDRNSNDKRHLVLAKYASYAGGYGFNFLFSEGQFNLLNPTVQDPQNPRYPYDVNDLRQVFGSSPKSWYGDLDGIGILENNGIYDYFNSGITTQELLLIRAEALARLDKTELALKELNSLRMKRIPKDVYVDLTAASGAEALELVLRERRIELAFSGLRLADIKRLNLEGRNISVTHGSVTIPANSPRFVLPIPSKVISLNPNIIPNER